MSLRKTKYGTQNIVLFWTALKIFILHFIRTEPAYNQIGPLLATFSDQQHQKRL